MYTATECWTVDRSVVFYEDNYDLTTSGDASMCAFGEPDFSEDAVAR